MRKYDFFHGTLFIFFHREYPSSIVILLVLLDLCTSVMAGNYQPCYNQKDESFGQLGMTMQAASIQDCILLVQSVECLWIEITATHNQHAPLLVL